MTLSQLHLHPDGLDALARLRRYLGPQAPWHIAALGNVEILRRHTTALFCSVQCPGRLIVQTYELVRQMRDAGETIISGFHSPLEQECLKLLLRGGQPIVVCPARSLERLRVPGEWQAPLEQGRLLVLSPFQAGQRRATAELARERNAFVAALADEVFVAHAAPGSKTLAFAREVLGWGKPVWTLAGSENAALAGGQGRPPLRRRWARG